MIAKNTAQELKASAQIAGTNLANARAIIQDSFTNDYVVGSSYMEKLIAAQHSVHYWTQVTRIVERAGSVAGMVQGLREWVEHTTDNLLEGGRSNSTSLVQSAITLSSEDELKRVLQRVRGCLSQLG